MLPREAIPALKQLAPKARLFRLARLCRQVLPSVEEYFGDASRRRYADSVVGMKHEVDAELPGRALDAVTSAAGAPSSSLLKSLARDYQEPITSIEDDDLAIADKAAEYGYLAIYNLVGACQDPEDFDKVVLVIRQVCAAIAEQSSSDNDFEGRLSASLTAWWSHCEAIRLGTISDDPE